MNEFEMMKVLIVGSKGQLGRALIDCAPDSVEITAHDLETLDITDCKSVQTVVKDVAPNLVLNAAAYTAVDKAEADEDAAYAVNATAVGILADAAREASARFIHVSTDFVFDGASSIPYATDAMPNPLSAYGRTKRAGEILAGSDALVVRTAWVYGPTGRNFVYTMLRLLAERDEVRVVVDQIGSPTYAPSLAAALWTLAKCGVRGVHHYTDAGVASWYDFAVAIHEEALAAGLLEQAKLVVPIGTADYLTPAKRPPYSVLDKSTTYAALGMASPHWRVNLRRMIAEIVRG